MKLKIHKPLFPDHKGWYFPPQKQVIDFAEEFFRHIFFISLVCFFLTCCFTGESQSLFEMGNFPIGEDNQDDL